MTVIRIDPQQLQAEGLINADMTRLLEARALTESRFGLFVNLSLIMGALAVAAGAIALVPDATTGLLLALLAIAAAELIRRFAGNMKTPLKPPCPPC